MKPIGRVESPLADPAQAPNQGGEGAPPAWLVVDPHLAEGTRDLRAGEHIIVLTWLDRARRDELSTVPGDNPDSSPLVLDEPLSALDQPTREDMRSLLQQLLTELEIPAAHVTHDRDEALSIGDDLAVIAGGQLRQTGPAATVAADPADPDVARLLGWSDLGHGTAVNGTVRIGQIVLPGTADMHGPVQVFYRPEDIELGAPAPSQPPSASLTAKIERIVHTRPLARISLASDPPIAALMLHRDIAQLQLTTGEPVQAHLPPHSLRMFQTR